jgi:arylsulfatase A-like enzyme
MTLHRWLACCFFCGALWALAEGSAILAFCPLLPVSGAMRGAAWILFWAFPAGWAGACWGLAVSGFRKAASRTSSLPPLSGGTAVLLSTAAPFLYAVAMTGLGWRQWKQPEVLWFMPFAAAAALGCALTAFHAVRLLPERFPGGPARMGAWMAATALACAFLYGPAFRMTDEKSAESAAARISGTRPPQASPYRMVLLVTVDTLRRDHLSLYGCEKPVSPALDAFLSRGAVFEDAFASKTHTAPSMASALSGLRPLRHGVLANRMALPPEIPVVPEAFAGAGWRTAAFLGNAVLYRPRYGFAPRFQRVRGYPFQTYSAGQVVEDFLRFAGENPGPFLAWLHFMEPHASYRPPQEYAEAFFKESPKPSPLPELPDREWRRILGPRWREMPEARRRDADWVQALYDGEIRHLDEQLEPLWGFLREREDALVLFAADHGENMNEHGKIFAHGWDCFDACARVPLALWDGGRRVRPARLRGLVSLEDVPSTLCEAAGLPPLGDVGGRSLWAAVCGEEPLPAREHLRLDGEYTLEAGHFALRTQRYKLVLRPDARFAPLGAAARWRAALSAPFSGPVLAHRFRAELYDLKDDPAEVHDAAAQNPALRREMKERLLEILRAELRNAAAEAPSSLRPVSDGEEKELKALGYLH